MLKIKIEEADFLRQMSTELSDILSTATCKDRQFEFEDEQLNDFLGEINFAIVDQGMDNQDTVNKVGIHLYEIYDDILWQADHQDQIDA